MPNRPLSPSGAISAERHTPTFFFWNGVRGRLLFLVLVATIPLLGVTAYTTWVLRSAQDKDTRAELQHLAETASDRLKSIAETSELLLKTLSYLPGVAAGEAAECERVFGEIMRNVKSYASFLVTDAKGQVLCHSAGLSEPVNLGDRDYFQRVRATKRFATGGPVVGRITGKPLMTLAYPLLDATGEFVGALAAGLDLHWFGKQFDDSRRDLNMIFTLWDEQGTILYRYPDHGKWVGKRVAESGIGKAVLSPQNGSIEIETTGVTGIPTLFTIRRDEKWSESGLSLSVGVAKAELHATADRIWFSSVIAFGIVFSVALFGALLIAEVAIRRPVAAISRAAMRLAEGERSARSGLKGNGSELGHLAAAFDEMADSLEAEHKRNVEATASLERANRALRVLSESNSTLIRARDEATLLQDMCRIAVDFGGYRSAWVGYAEQDEAKRIRPVARTGYDTGYLEKLNLTWADRARGHGPMGTAIRTGEVLIARNILIDPDYASFRARALEHGYAASIGLPLRKNGQIIGALEICAADPGAFDESEVKLLMELAGDLAYGIRVLRNRVELDRHRSELEGLLRERNEGYGMVLQTAMDGFWTVDTQGRFLEVNDSYCRLIGYSREELLAMSLVDIDAAETPEQTAAHLAAITRAGLDRFETRHRRKDGAILDVEISVNYLPQHGGRFYVFVRDVTERKRMEEALKASKRWIEQELARRSAELEESERRLRLVGTAIEQAPVSVFITDSDGRIEYMNPAFTRITGYEYQEILGQHPRLLNSPRQGPNAHRELRTAVLAGLQWRGELINRSKDGADYAQDLTVTPVRDASGKNSHFICIGLDITQRKRVEETLRESEDRYRDLVENSGDLICTHNLEGGLLSVNAAVSKALGHSQDALLGMNLGELLTPRTREHFPQYLTEVRDNGHAEGVMAVQTAGGDTRYWEFRNTLRSGGPAGTIVRGMARDVTDRRQMEKALKESETKFRGLVEQSLVGIYMVDGEKVHYSNPRADEILGYATGELAGVSVNALIVDQDLPAVQREIGRVMSGEVPAANLDFRGRRKDGSEVTIGAQGLRADVGGRPIIIGVMQDITDKKRAEEQLQRYVLQLKNAFMHTIEVATTLSELRDPYTAGHERRVAEIAVAIGAELGLDTDRQEGLRVAGLLHDIGKISIPAEILSKPRKLSDLEFGLVKAHPQASYDVLKGVEFPWPVVQVALQHHERIDGSGYPQGLKGEEILFEARIMAVADVVEAMSSHRPYRPGLGIDRALAEIERGRGIVYDPLVADACLRLFREKHYQLPA